MISSKEAFLLKVKEAIASEFHAAECFRLIAEHLSNSDKQDFLNYAEEEIAHANKLMHIYETLTGEKCYVSVPEAPTIDNILIFLIDYQSGEESGIFLYESLYRLSENAEHKAIFKAIKEEEEVHFKRLGELIDRYKKGVWHNG